jgi:site-specific recombinase XerD
MTMSKETILPLFDSLKCINDDPVALRYVEEDHLQDFTKALSFLRSYKGSLGTFTSYRRDIERLLQWSWTVANKPLKDLKREDIEVFIGFCQNPPKSWIGLKKLPRFVGKEKMRKPNMEWRPFLAKVSKRAFKQGEKPDVRDFGLSETSIKDMFSILSSFFNYLLQEDYISSNPVTMIRQKSQFIQKQQRTRRIRRLTPNQWQYVFNTAKQMAKEEPAKHERTLFMLSLLYGMYLRISELVASDRWTPTMNNFFADHHNNWWFVTVGKGNKKRQIAVSDSVLEALKRWRKYLNLTLLPSPSDNSPLLPRMTGKGPLTHTGPIREIVQECFDRAVAQLKLDNHMEESENLMEATVHWLRHTGISDDVKIRPREHVRDDAGHSSSAITDKYIDVELTERHASAKSKVLE